MLIRTDKNVTINPDNIVGIVVEQAENDRWALNIYDVIGCRHTIHTYTKEYKADEARFWLEHWLVKPPVGDVVIGARYLTAKKFREFYRIESHRRFSEKKIAEAEKETNEPEDEPEE